MRRVMLVVAVACVLTSMAAARTFKIKYGTQTTIRFAVYDSNQPWALYESALASGDVFIGRNGKAETATTNNASDLGKTHSITITAAEAALTYGVLVVQDQTSPAAFGDEVFEIETWGDPNATYPSLGPDPNGLEKVVIHDVSDAASLMSTSDMDSIVTANASVVAIAQTSSRLGNMLEDDGSGGYQFTTLSVENAGGLDAAAIRTALGMASADLDDQMDAIYADVADMYSIFPSLATGTVGTADTANSCTLSAAFSTVASAYPRGTLVKFTDATSGLSYVSRLTRYTTGRVLTVDPGFPVVPEVGDAITMYAIVWPFFGF